MNQKSRLITVFVTMAAVLVITIVAVFAASQNTVRLYDDVIRQRQVIMDLRQTLSTLVNAETGQRGYLLTGDEAYLTPYNFAGDHIQNELATLKNLSSAGELPDATVTQINDLANEKMAELQATVELYRAGKTEAAVQRVKTGAGKRTMDSFRDVIGRLMDNEFEELQSTLATAERGDKYLLFVFVAALSINLLFLFWAYSRIRREIERRQAAQAETKNQKDLLAVTLASIGDAVIVTDENARITFMNSVAEQLTGWKLAEARQKPCGEVFRIINEETRATVESPVAKVLRDGVVVGLANHTLLICKDGTEIAIDDSGAPIRDSGNRVRGVVLVFRDFTEHKSNERKLRKITEELQAAGRAKDQFMAALSHELRTPLTPVLATLTSWEASDELPVSLVSDVQMIRRNIELEARLIDDLLDLTRIAKGKMPINLEVVDVHDLLRSVSGMYESEMLIKRIRLSLRLEAKRYYVKADPGRLQQVFGNILKNAAKFTPEGGEVTVVTANNAEDRIGIAFADSGIGMTPETMSRLFHPFEQGAEDIARRFGGLGLGMAISKAVVDAQAGTLNANSAGRGRGSTFTATFATVDAPVQSRPAAPPKNRDAESGHGVRILLVEDHEDTAKVIARLLRLKGHDVQISDSVASAENMIASHEFDLLLSDLGLPDGTGIDLIRQVRQHYKMPAVALTGFGMEEDIARCREAGFTAHLTKPVNFQRLEMLIRELVSR